MMAMDRNMMMRSKAGDVLSRNVRFKSKASSKAKAKAKVKSRETIKTYTPPRLLKLKLQKKKKLKKIHEQAAASQPESSPSSYSSLSASTSTSPTQQADALQAEQPDGSSQARRSRVHGHSPLQHFELGSLYHTYSANRDSHSQRRQNSNGMHIDLDINMKHAICDEQAHRRGDLYMHEIGDRPACKMSNIVPNSANTEIYSNRAHHHHGRVQQQQVHMNMNMNMNYRAAPTAWLASFGDDELDRFYGYAARAQGRESTATPMMQQPIAIPMDAESCYEYYLTNAVHGVSNQM